MKTSLVLEGGGMKGLYTAGVIDVLIENEIVTDVLLGVSAGASFGCNFKSRQAGRVIRYITKYRNYWKFASWRSFFLTGNYFNAKFCYETIPDELDVFDTKAFSECKTEMYAVATDVESGKAVYTKVPDGNKRDVEWMRASSSVPIVSKIVNIDGHKYLDGGMACSIPIEKALELGCDKNLVVYTKADGVHKSDSGFLPLAKIIYRKYPEFIKTFADCDNEYLKETAIVDSCVKNGTALLIRPSKDLGVSGASSDVKKLRQLYELGRSDTLAKLDEIKSFLSN